MLRNQITLLYDVLLLFSSNIPILRRLQKSNVLEGSAVGSFVENFAKKTLQNTRLCHYQIVCSFILLACDENRLTI